MYLDQVVVRDLQDITAVVMMTVDTHFLDAMSQNHLDALVFLAYLFIQRKEISKFVFFEILLFVKGSQQKNF